PCGSGFVARTPPGTVGGVLSVMPLPDSGTVSAVAPDASDATQSRAWRLPSALGENTRSTVKNAPGASVAGGAGDVIAESAALRPAMRRASRVVAAWPVFGIAPASEVLAGGERAPTSGRPRLVGRNVAPAAGDSSGAAQPEPGPPFTWNPVSATVSSAFVPGV